MKKKLTEYTIEDLIREARGRKFLFGLFLGLLSLTIGISIYAFIQNEIRLTSYIPLFLILFLPVMWKQYSSVAKELKKRQDI